MKAIANKYISSLFVLGILVINSANAQQTRTQDTILKTQEFNVYQVYIPEVQKKVKGKIKPELPKFDAEKINYIYTVPEQQLSYTYQAVPIRPLALGVDNVIDNYENYVKAGLGNLSTILVDAGISAIQAKNFQSIIHAKHLSQKKDGSINRQNSNTDVDAVGYYQLKEHDVVSKFNFNRKGMLYYGERKELGLPAIDKDSLRQVYWGINASVGLENSNGKPFTYQPKIDLGYYADKFESSEVAFNLQLPIAYRINDNLDAGIKYDLNLIGYKYGNFTDNNHMMAFNPYVNLKWWSGDFHIGVKPTFGKDNNFYLMPDIAASIPLKKEQFTLHAGFKGQVIQNSFEQLTNKNPFLYGKYIIKQTAETRIFAGFDAKINRHVSLGGSIGWNVWKNLPIFLNDYTRAIDGRYFTIDYDTKVTGINLDGYFKYQISETFGVVGSGAWTQFIQKDIYDKVYHEPQIKLGAELFTKPVDGLTLGLKLEYWDRIFYRNYFNESEKLPSFADLSLQGEYQVIPRLSLFLQLNNILNQEYQRWAHYNAYGFNVLGGLRFKF